MMADGGAGKVSHPHRGVPLSVTDLRDNLQIHLKKTGALANLKTQLRAFILSELATKTESKKETDAKGQGGKGLLSVSHGGTLTANIYASSIADDIVESHLRATNRHYSHSIFMSEADVGSKKEPSCSDSNDHVIGIKEDGELCATLDLPFPHHDPAAFCGMSPLTMLVEKVLKRRALAVAAGVGGNDTSSFYLPKDSCCQTDESEIVNCGTAPSYLSMEKRLALVDAQYALKFSHNDHNFKATVEQRLSQHKEELEIQMKREFEHKMQQFRAHELSQMRKEEAERYDMMERYKSVEMAEFERSCEHRMKLERERLEDNRAELDMHRAAVDKRGRDMMAMVEEREQGVTRLERLLDEKARFISAQKARISQLEELCDHRLQEAECMKLREQRRVEDIRRLKGEQELELRVRDDENSELRYKLRVLAEEYRNHMDRMSLDVRMATQQYHRLQTSNNNKQSDSNSNIQNSYISDIMLGSGEGGNKNRDDNRNIDAVDEILRSIDEKRSHTVRERYVSNRYPETRQGPILRHEGNDGNTTGEHTRKRKGSSTPNKKKDTHTTASHEHRDGAESVYSHEGSGSTTVQVTSASKYHAPPTTGDNDYNNIRTKERYSDDTKGSSSPIITDRTATAPSDIIEKSLVSSTSGAPVSIPKPSSEHNDPNNNNNNNNNGTGRKPSPLPYREKRSSPTAISPIRRQSTNNNNNNNNNNSSTTSLISTAYSKPSSVSDGSISHSPQSNPTNYIQGYDDGNNNNININTPQRERVGDRSGDSGSLSSSTSDQKRRRPVINKKKELKEEAIKQFMTPERIAEYSHHRMDIESKETRDRSIIIIDHCQSYINMTSTFILGDVISSIVTLEDNIYKGLLWSWNTELVQIKMALESRKVTAGGVISNNNNNMTYVGSGGGVIITRDSSDDDSGRGLGLFREGSSEEDSDW